MPSSPSQPPRPKVVLVEDHVLVADYFALVLRTKLGLEVCGRAVDARGGLRLVEAERPDLVIVDLTLAGGHGLELIKNIACLPFRPGILVVSGHDEAVYAERALEAGALGYLRKTHDTLPFLEAVRRVLAGKNYFSPDVITHMLHRRRHLGASIALTDREVQVLEGLGQGRSSKEMAASLGIDVGTIETYRARLRSKLGLRNSEALRIYAYHWVHFGARPPGLVIVASTPSGRPSVKAPPDASRQGPSEDVP